MPLKNFYTANDALPGDIFMVVVKATVQYDGSFRLYRCPWQGWEEDIPQGDRVFVNGWWDQVDGEENAESTSDLQIAGEKLFPILQYSRGADLSG